MWRIRVHLCVGEVDAVVWMWDVEYRWMTSKWWWCQFGFTGGRKVRRW